MRNPLAASAVVAALVSVLAAPAQSAGVKITEWMYNGDEFIELANLGPTPVDFTGWSYDDDSRAPGTVSLASFGTLAPGGVAIIAESSEADFRLRWGISGGVKVLGGNRVNLGRADEINLFDASGALVDRLRYGDIDFPGSPRTLNISGRPATLAALGANDPTQWVLSSVGDGAGSYLSLDAAFIGNPGIAPVPEPQTYALMAAGLALVAGFARRTRRAA